MISMFLSTSDMEWHAYFRAVMSMSDGTYSSIGNNSFFSIFLASWPGLSPFHGLSCFSVITSDTTAIFALSMFISLAFFMRDELCLSHAFIFLVGWYTRA